MQTDNWKGIGILAVLVVLVAGYLFFVRAPQKSKEAAPQGKKTETSGASVPTPASSGAIVAARSSQSLGGEYLTDGRGMTLYVFGKDKSGESSCYDACAETWTPFLYDGKDLKNFSDDLTKRLNVIKRKDGKSQYAYGLKPLYYYKGDKNSGDVSGHGVETVWSAVLITK